MTDNFWQLMEEGEKEASSGGGGIICKADITLGYKVFTSGLSPEDSFFPFTTETEKKAAKAAASKVGRAHPAVCFHAYKDSVKGREVGWNGDQWWAVPQWTSRVNKDQTESLTFYSEVLVPAMKELGLTFGTYWLRFSWAADPSGRTRTNQVGETVPVTQAYPVERYANEQEATEAGNSQAESFATGEAEIVEVPEWVKELAEKELAENEGNVDVPAFAAKYGQSEAVVNAAIEAVNNEIPV